MIPVLLPANRPPERFYRGGTRIEAFRGTGGTPEREPEDWVGSTTAVNGAAPLGMTVLPDGRSLADAVAADPQGWLGAAHVAAHGACSGLLVKLLDAGERLPVHLHPDRPFAAANLGLHHGKTESWIVLEPGPVWLGWTRDLSRGEVDRMVREQDGAAMLAAMHRLDLERGQAVFVPAGTPHAIGAGCFVVELQEPTDLSILMEWEGFAIDGPRAGHLGLGFDLALDALDRTGRPEAEIRSWVTPAGATDLFPGHERFFRADRVGDGTVLEPSFAILVVTAGAGALRGDFGELPVRAGQTVLVPFAAGAVTVVGVEVIRCRPGVD